MPLVTAQHYYSLSLAAPHIDCNTPQHSATPLSTQRRSDYASVRRCNAVWRRRRQPLLCLQRLARYTGASKPHYTKLNHCLQRLARDTRASKLHYTKLNHCFQRLARYTRASVAPCLAHLTSVRDRGRGVLESEVWRTDEGRGLEDRRGPG